MHNGLEYVFQLCDSMEKMFIIADLKQPRTSASKDTDWNKCVICHEIIGEVLKCLTNS